MKKQITIITSSVFFIAACSSVTERQIASGGFKYLEIPETEKELIVPDDLNKPRRSNQYALPQLQTQNDTTLIGEDIKVTSPRLVLPIVAGSHVEEGAKTAKVNFDKIDDSTPLDTAIWDKVLSYLEQNNIGVESFNRDNNELITDWVISKTEIDSSWYEISDQFVEHAKKFKLSLDIAPHGRTASLENEMVAYVNDEGNSNLSALSPIKKRDDEAEFLNYIITEYDFNVRLAQVQRISKIREGFGSSLGFDPDGDSAYLIDAEFDDAWPRLLLVLRKMNFDVVDLDQSSGILFVVYNGEDEGFFTNLFGTQTLPLDQGNYRIFVKRAGQKTSVTLKDDESVTLDVDTITGIYPSFKEFMASDNLDI